MRPRGRRGGRHMWRVDPYDRSPQLMGPWVVQTAPQLQAGHQQQALLQQLQTQQAQLQLLHQQQQSGAAEGRLRVEYEARQLQTEQLQQHQALVQQLQAQQTGNWPAQPLGRQMVML